MDHFAAILALLSLGALALRLEFRIEMRERGALLDAIADAEARVAELMKEQK